MKIKLKDGTLLPIGGGRPLTLGDELFVKREFGILYTEADDLRDPAVRAAWLYAGLRANDPDASSKALVAQIERIRGFDIVGDDGEPLAEIDEQETPDPTPPAPTDSDAHDN